MSVLSLRLGAQTTDYDLSLDLSEQYLLMRSDYSLFVNALESEEDIFTKLSTYNFSYQRYLRRGYAYNYSSTKINGIELDDNFSQWPYFALINTLRGMRTKHISQYNIFSSTNYSLKASDAPLESRASVSYVNRNSPLALKGLYSRQGDFVVYADAKLGRDEQIEGLWGEYYNLGFSMDRQLSQRGVLSLFVGANYAKYSSRSATTEEVFDLTDDKLYNPSWGYLSGEVLSSRVNEQLEPSAMLTYDYKVSDYTSLSVSGLYIYTSKSYTSLLWDDALSPYPDYYQWLPSFLDEGDTKDEITEQWVSGNTSLTQIDWDQILTLNNNSGDRALYYFQRQQQNKHDFRLHTELNSETKINLKFNYGAEYNFSSMSVSNVLDDALGSKYVLSDKDEKVYEGEVIDYNSGFYLNKFEAFAEAKYNKKRLAASLGLSVGYENFYRRDLVDDAKSKSLGFDTYSLDFSTSYRPWNAHVFKFSLALGSEAPYASDVFISPYYANSFTANPRSKQRFSSELNYSFRHKSLTLNLSLYHTKFSNELKSYSYYDDIYECYSSLILSDLSSVHQGFELGVEVKLKYGFSLSGALGYGKYYYANNPDANIYAQDSGKQLGQVQTAYIKDYYIANTPQFVASTQLTYSGFYGIMASIGVNYSSRSYVEINPLRRTLNITEAAYYPELVSELTEQECLPSATTVSLFVYKGFKIAGHEFYATLQVSNLLASEIVYSGYEQMRLSVKGSGVDTYYVPFDNKYLYSYSRTFRANLAYKF